MWIDAVTRFMTGHGPEQLTTVLGLVRTVLELGLVMDQLRRARERRRRRR